MNLSYQAASYGSWNVSGLVSTAIPNMGHLYSHFTQRCIKMVGSCVCFALGLALVGRM